MEQATIKTAPKNNAIENKPRASLNPDDLIIEFLTPAYEEGLIKYSRESWRGGFEVSVMFDALKRHITKFYYEGEDFDPDSRALGVNKHHLGGAMFCILSILQTLKTRPELDDRPNKITLDKPDNAE